MQVVVILTLMTLTLLLACTIRRLLEHEELRPYVAGVMSAYHPEYVDVRDVWAVFQAQSPWGGRLSNVQFYAHMSQYCHEGYLDHMQDGDRCMYRLNIKYLAKVRKALG